MPEKANEPPKFNILEALNKEIGKQEKKLREAQGKKDEKTNGQEDAKRPTGKSRPKDASPEGDVSDASETPGTATVESSESPQEPHASPEEVIRSLTALRDWLENELLAHRGGVLDSIGRIVDEYTKEPQKKLTKRFRFVGLILFFLVIGLLIGNVLDFYPAHHVLPGWLQWIEQIRLAH